MRGLSGQQLARLDDHLDRVGDPAQSDIAQDDRREHGVRHRAERRREEEEAPLRNTGPTFEMKH